MICLECKGDNVELDDRMGEKVCNDCGYVLISNLPEETVPSLMLENGYITSGTMPGQSHMSRNPDKGHLGSIINNEYTNNKLVRTLLRTQQRFKGKQQQSIDRGLIECNMALSPYLPNPNLKERVSHYYEKLFKEKKLIGFTLPVRGVALVLFVLKENGLPISVIGISKQNNVSPSRVSKCARLMARSLGKPHILHKMPISNWIDKVVSDLFKLRTTKNQSHKKDFGSDARQVTEYIHQYLTDRDIAFTRSYIASAIWFTCQLRKFGNNCEFTQEEISDVCNCTSVALRSTNRKVFNTMNIDKEKLLKLHTSQFIAGVRHV